MIDIFTYFTRLPDGVREMVAPCPDGYTVYIDTRLDEETKKAAYQHALYHINACDWNRDNVQAIEAKAHGRKA